MNKYYDCEIIIRQESTYMIRHKKISKLNGEVERLRENIKKDTESRIEKAGAKVGNVNVEIILHESTPPPEPVPCPLCGAKTEVEGIEQMTSVHGKTTLWYKVSHSIPLIDDSCPLALSSKPFHKYHRTPYEAIENWNRWCRHEHT